MPLSEYGYASGTKILAGVTGQVHAGSGRLILTIASRHGVDENLILALKTVSEVLELVIVAGSLDTGQHVANSRHYKGCAADVTEIYPMGGRMMIASLTNPHAIEVYDYLRGAGWHIGEGGAWPGLLLGPPRTRLNPSTVDHHSHLHVSIYPGRHPGDKEEEGLVEDE